MAAPVGKEFLDSAFLISALSALRGDGFISDKHPFALRREALQIYGADIENELSLRGFEGCLRTCFMLHESVGFVYALYDSTQYADHNAACGAITKWLDKSMGVVPRRWP